MTTGASHTTTSLPRHLQSWASLLAPVRPELGADLAGLSQLIASALKQFFNQSLSGHNEPDGYAGISRKGTPERLLISEWALAEVFPDEFLRRAVMKEQLFLDPKQTSPQMPQWITLLLDCGPMQWGAPRLAHLATLIVLARYASERQAQLRWAPLQTPDAPWQEGVSRENLQNWLHSHDFNPPEADAIHHWRKRLDEESITDDQKATDLWLIGGCGLKKLTDVADGLIICEEPLDPSLADTLALTIRRRSLSQTLSLPLPEKPIQVRLLRHPLRPDTTASAKEESCPKDSFEQCLIQFSHLGHQLTVRQPLGRVRIYNIPTPGKYEPKIKIRKIDKGFMPILGTDSRGKRLLVLQVGQDECLYFNSPGSWLRRVSECLFTDKPVHPQSTLLKKITLYRHGWYPCQLHGDQVYLCDAGLRLWHYDGANAPDQIAEQVVYFTLDRSGCLSYLQYTPDKQTFSWMVQSDRRYEAAAYALPEAAQHLPVQRPQAFIRHNQSCINTLAYPTEDNCWAIIHGTQSWLTQPVDPDCHILGIKLGTDGELHKPGLLCLHGAELVSLGEKTPIRLRHFGKAPIAIAYDLLTDRIAWVDQEHELYVQELTSQHCLLQQSLQEVKKQHD